MADVLARVERDLAAGELWRARRRLEGYVASAGYDPAVLDRLGETCWRMGDVPAAGRFWFFTTADTDDKRLAIETFLRQAGGEPAVIASQLPRKLRVLRPDRFPVDVQKRLRLVPPPPPVPPAAAVPPGRPSLTELFLFSAILLAALFFLYCFSVGLAEVLAIG